MSLNGQFFQLAALAIVLTLTSTASAQIAVNVPKLVTQGIEGERLITLAGTTRPEANSKADRGAVPDTLAMEHLWLQLKRARLSSRKLYTST